MKATLCDRCGQRIIEGRRSKDPLIRIYLELSDGEENVWREFHQTCASTLTVAELINASWKD